MRAPSLRFGLTLILACGLATGASLAACSSDPESSTDAGVQADTAAPLPTDAAVADTAPPDAADAADAADPCDDKGPDGLPNDLGCTGLYASVATKTVSADVAPYVPGTPFWSDGAEKSRFLFLPAGAKIDTSDMAAWKWPVGTKVWKEFKLEGKRIETRHYVKVADKTWRRTTYRWNAGETAAKRFDDGAILADGYEIPTPNKCDTCHYGGQDQLLGLEPVSLAMPGAQGVTLAKLVADGRLTAPPSQTTAVLPEDSTGKAAAAIKWLHGNCAACHNDSPFAGASAVGLRLALKPSEVLSATPTAVSALSLYTTSYCTDSRFAPPDAGGALKNLAGGNKDLSALYVRANTRDKLERIQMPPIGSHKVDTAGVAALGEWLDALPPCP